MTHVKASPLSSAEPWDLVAAAYTNEITPEFEYFARGALRLAAPSEPADLIDVATGPGTLAVLAARAGQRVTAIDFSTEMVAALQARLASEPELKLQALVGDGMALPFADAAFAAGFSMFGLMFFPDRNRGFRELHRVLVPGARAVVSSWQPLERMPQLAAVFAALNEFHPPPPGTPPFKPPLADPEECRQEMALAGFRDVSVHELTHTANATSIQAVWESFERSSAPIALLRSQLGSKWPDLSGKIVAQLRARFGDGQQALAMPAYLTVGTR